MSNTTTSNSDVPNLLEMWNNTRETPYTVTFWRPFTLLGKSTYEYKFEVLGKAEEKNNNFTNAYHCQVNIRKLSTAESGTSQVNQTIVNDFKLIYSNKRRYLIECERLNKTKYLSNVLVLAVEYRPRSKAWVIVGAPGQLSQLFTMGMFEGFGWISHLLAKECKIEFLHESSEMVISMKNGPVPLFEAKLDDGTCVNHEEVNLIDKLKTSLTLNSVANSVTNNNSSYLNEENLIAHNANVERNGISSQQVNSLNSQHGTSANCSQVNIATAQQYSQPFKTYSGKPLNINTMNTIPTGDNRKQFVDKMIPLSPLSIDDSNESLASTVVRQLSPTQHEMLHELLSEKNSAGKSMKGQSIRMTSFQH